MADTLMAAEDVEEVSLDEVPPFIPESVAPHEIAMRNFSQVIFPDIPDCFPPDADTKVSYILTEAISPTSKDWIGLFRVGWASPRDYSTYVWASKSKSLDVECKTQHVIFQAYQLPGEDNEFYQLCYVTKNGHVKGASTPFQFRVCNENDCLVEVEDETGMIILQTKSDTLEGKITALTEEKASMEETIQGLTKEKLCLETESQKQLEELALLRKQYKSIEDENMVFQSTLSDKNAEIEKLTKSLAETESKLSDRITQIAIAEQTMIRLSAEKKTLETQIEAAEVQQKEAEERHLFELNKRDQQIQEYQAENYVIRKQIADLSLIKEDSLKASSIIEIEKEEALRASLKMKEEASAKMKRYQDERDMFKTQLTESEMARQNGLLDLHSLEKQLASAEKAKASLELEVSSKEQKIVKVSGKLSDLEKKYKHETNKYQDLIRNNLDRANALNAAKQLLAVELSETAATKDTLMADMNAVKQEKEKLNDELKYCQASLHAVQCQLTTVEEKLQSSELQLNDFKASHQEQLKEGEDVQREMHVDCDAQCDAKVETKFKQKNHILTLQKELEEANIALAKAVEEAAARESMPALKDASSSQTVESPQSSKLVTEVKSSSTEDLEVEDLKNQVKDLTTRLQMGAEAYKDKFIECHKLERKVKKLQQSQCKKSPQASSQPVATATSSSSSKKEQSDRPAGWGGKLEQLFKTITDPDDSAQSTQLQQKVESLERNFEVARNKHKRYKQLYKEERDKLADLSEKTAVREFDLSHALNNAESQNCLLVDENAGLRMQLDELTAVRPSRDGATNPQYIHRPVIEDDLQFEDAPGVPMCRSSDRPSRRPKKSQKERKNSEGSDSAGEYPLGQDGIRFSKFNMCSEASRQDRAQDESPQGVSIPRMSKVVRQQPIRSPPHVGEARSSSRDTIKITHSSSGISPDARKRVTKSKPRSKDPSREGAQNVREPTLRRPFPQ